jgi:hypothetical protein
MKKLIYILTLFCFVLSCSEIIGVEDISDKTLSVIAPTNGAILNTGTLIFTWDSLEDAEEYKIQIATPSFENAIQILTDSTLTTTSFSTTLENGNYQWRIRAENSGYQTQFSTQNFTIEE